MGDAPVERRTIFDINFIRPGSLGLTQRPLSKKPQFTDDRNRTIQISLGLSKQPLTLVVRKFVPDVDDVVERFWIAEDGATKNWTPLAAYAIDDVDAAAAAIDAYIRDNCLCFAEVVSHSDPNVRAVYELVAPHVERLRAAAARPEADDVDREILNLMELYCPLWWGIRNMMGSAWLVGEETLGMRPCFDPGYPLYGKVSVPRQVVQVAGCLFNQATRPRQEEFLRAFNQAVRPDRPLDFYRRAFYTIFLLVYVILHECEDINKDRERYARQNFLPERFSLPEYVEALHQSARLVCDIWYEYAMRVRVNFSACQYLEQTLFFLPQDQVAVILATYAAVGRDRTNSSLLMRASPETWTQDMCFIAHMFDLPWRADALFKGK